jgi:hypothetical protein
MTDLSELSKEERALIAWCRSVRDWPIPALAWHNFRANLYAAVIYGFLLVTAAAVGWLHFSRNEVVGVVVWWVIVPGLCGFFIWWLTSRFQRMAALIDKLGRWVETEEARRLAGVGRS